jgi:hypothetical protein
VSCGLTTICQGNDGDLYVQGAEAIENGGFVCAAEDCAALMLESADSGAKAMVFAVAT